MKRVLLFAIVICSLLIANCQLIFAQSPQSFSFQAVVRDGSGDLVTSSAVGMRISLLQGSEIGSAVYVETHTPNTNANGLASVPVGGGSVVSGTFATIDWAAGPYYIKSETDPNGGTSYSITGTQQLMSVPYALFAANAGDGGGLDDGSEAGNTPYWNGTEWVTNSSNIHNNGGNVGIGTTSPAGVLHVQTQGEATMEDQSTASVAGSSLNINAGVWQSFTPGVTGQLTSLMVNGSSPLYATNYNLIIRQGEGTGGTVVATVNGWHWPHSTNIEWKTINFPSLPTLTAGQVYTWQLVNALGDATSGLIFHNLSNPYPGGRSVASASSDMLFTTHMKSVVSYPVLVVNEDKLGVGTASPTANLHVAGTIRVDDGNAAVGKVLMASDASGNASWIASSAMPSGSAAGNTLYWDGSSWLSSSNIFNNGGNVGVGTSAPAGTLDVHTTMPSANVVMDQNQSSSASSLSINASRWQSFTAGITGNLAKVELWAHDASAGITSYTLNLYSGQGVGGSLLAAVTGVQWPAASQSGPAEWKPFVFSTPPGLVAGQQYTWQLVRTSASSGGLEYIPFNVYIGGRSDTDPNTDYCFRTYMTGMLESGSVLFANNGNVGIGTTTPAAKLEIAGQVKIAGGSPGAGKILVSDANGLASWSSGPVGPAGPSGATGPTGLLSGGSVAGNTPYWNGSSWVTNSSNIYNNGGNVGIGTVSANAKLHVADEGRFETANGIIRLTPTGWRVAERAQLKVYSKAANPAELDLGHTDGGIEYGWQVSARGSSDLRKLMLYSRHDGAFTSRFTVQHTDGNVGVGTTNPAEKMEVAGKVRAEGYTTRNGTLGAYGGNIFNFNWTGSTMQLWVDDQNVGTLTMTSDRRLKDHINPLTDNAIDRVMALRPVDFYYKDIKGTIFAGSPVQQEGFIADELQAVIPSAVNGEKDGMTEDGKIQPQTVNVMPVVSVLTKAVQEQQVLIEQQQAMIAEQQKQLLEYQAKLDLQQAQMDAMKTENGALRSDIGKLSTSLESLQQIITGRAER